MSSGYTTHLHRMDTCSRQQHAPFFSGFLQAVEFTVPSPRAYDWQVHLNLDDLAIDSHYAPSMVRICIKQSKTDPFRQGIGVYLGATGLPLCPVQALRQYLASSVSAPGPLFIQSSRTPLTLKYMVDQLHQALLMAGIDATSYNCQFSHWCSNHSSRTGS